MKTYPIKLAIVLYFFIHVLIPVSGQPKVDFSLGSKDFLLNGKPLQMISGEMHYTRIPKEYWRHRMKMAKAMGLNSIGTYIFWNAHEPTPGKYDFSGNNNIAEFIKIAGEEGLWVVLRPSPYVCAEWEFGGYPWWLLKDSTLKVRTNDPGFVAAYTNYINKLAKEIVPLLSIHGGNILMVQIENEYGSYSDDKSYLDLNRRIFREAGFDGILFTCDGADKMPYGYLPGFLPAVNGLENPVEVKELINKFHNGQGPYYVAEWYPGWFDQWGKPHAQVSGENTAEKLDKLLSAGISVNMYMFHGGSTRGYMNGANMNFNEPYAPQTSGYDYDAPLDEAGHPTKKFHLFRNVISKYLPAGTSLPDIPATYPVISIPGIKFNKHASLFENLPAPFVSTIPLSFEEIDQPYGYVLYRSKLSRGIGAMLKIEGLRDYAIIYINNKRVGVLDRRLEQDSVFIPDIPINATLDILVENNGRINYGPYLTDNRKGILEKVKFGDEEVLNWEIFSLPVDKADFAKFKSIKKNQLNELPGFYKASFKLNETGDTFLDLSNFGKGVVFLNGHHIGKYWNIGPQQTIFIPGAWLKKGKNEIIVFDQLIDGHKTISSLSTSILNQLSGVK
jgi:beta-galactosidase